MTIGDVPDSEGQRNANETDAQARKGSSQHRATVPAQDQPECPEEVRTIFFHALLNRSSDTQHGTHQRGTPFCHVKCRYLLRVSEPSQ
jgi:hypothetical protein